MRKLRSALLLMSSILVMSAVQAQETTYQTHPADSRFAGRWTVSTDFYGTPLYFSLELEQNGDKLTGNFSGDIIRCCLLQSGVAIRSILKAGIKRVTAASGNLI